MSNLHSKKETTRSMVNFAESVLFFTLPEIAKNAIKWEAAGSITLMAKAGLRKPNERNIQ